jgi:hypothetical protein
MYTSSNDTLRISRFAVGSFVLGIFSIVLDLKLFIIGEDLKLPQLLAIIVISFVPISTLLSIAFGFVTLDKVKKGLAKGRSFAFTGIVTSLISLAFFIFFFTMGF